MIQKMILNSREEWLEKRKSYIGGSDVGAVVGVNPFCTNVELWEVKTGRKKPEDISDNPVVRYGSEAEAPLRELFKLDHPNYRVEYEPNNIWINTDYPWAHASLDGWMYNSAGQLGILEIKTANIKASCQGDMWRERIPDRYYVQILHYMMVTGAVFAILKAQLKYEHEDVIHVTRHYHIDRLFVEEDIRALIELERGFAGFIERNERPPLILPQV